VYVVTRSSDDAIIFVTNYLSAAEAWVDNSQDYEINLISVESR